jgi:hypothetical protein
MLIPRCALRNDRTQAAACPAGHEPGLYPRDRTAACKYPCQAEFLDELPKTVSGKLLAASSVPAASCAAAASQPMSCDSGARRA